MSRFLLGLLAFSTAAFAGDKDFDRIVHAIETHYGVHRTHVPLMGVANLFVKAKHLDGVSRFKLAIFQDLDSSAGDFDFMDRFSAGSLHRLVRVKSKPDSESTYIFSEEAGKSTRVLVATFDSREATVVEVKMDADALVKLLADPQNMGKAIGGDRDQ